MFLNNVFRWMIVLKSILSCVAFIALDAHASSEYPSGCDVTHGLYDVSLNVKKGDNERKFSSLMHAGCDMPAKSGVNLSFPVSIDGNGVVKQSDFFEGIEMTFNISIGDGMSPHINLNLIESDIFKIVELENGFKLPQINLVYAFKEFGLSPRHFGRFHFDFNGSRYVLSVSKLIPESK